MKNNILSDFKIAGLLIVILVGIFFSIFSSLFVLAIQPFGADNLTVINSSTAPVNPAASASAVAGNVTEIDLNGYTVTQSWQGYYGNITGTILLGNSNNNVLYNWTDASPKGEVYASTNSSISWTNIQCFNYTATGTYENDDLNRGGTSQYGTNLTQLQSEFNISSDAPDSVNNTFNLNGTGNHATFYTNNLEFADGTCQSTRLFTNAGQGEVNKFEEVLLYDPNTKSLVFTTILDQDIFGFDNRTHDFEMIVLEDGHGTDTKSTPYYFYVELQ